VGLTWSLSAASTPSLPLLSRPGILTGLFVRHPEGNGCVEGFFRTLKEQLPWVRSFEDVEQRQEALAEFRARYHEHWLVERLRFESPRQVRHRPLALEVAP